MKTSFLLGGWLLAHLLLVGCGDDSTTGGAGGGGSSAGGEAQGGEAQGGDAQGGEAQGGDAQGGEAQGGEGQGGASAIAAAIDEVGLVGNCKPEIGADPLAGSFTATYVNGGPVQASLAVESARLQLTGIDATLTWTFAVAPATSGAVSGGQAIQVIHDKVPDSGSGDKGDITPCSYCGAGGQLTVAWADGQEETIAIAAFPCAL